MYRLLDWLSRRVAPWLHALDVWAGWVLWEARGRVDVPAKKTVKATKRKSYWFRL